MLECSYEQLLKCRLSCTLAQVYRFSYEHVDMVQILPSKNHSTARFSKCSSVAGMGSDAERANGRNPIAYQRKPAKRAGSGRNGRAERMQSAESF